MIEIYADSVLISKTHERTISRSTKETSIVVHLTLNAINILVAFSVKCASCMSIFRINSPFLGPTSALQHKRTLRIEDIPLPRASVSQRVSVIFPLRNHGTWLPPSPEREEPRSKLNIIRHDCISTNNIYPHALITIGCWIFLDDPDQSKKHTVCFIYVSNLIKQKCIILKNFEYKELQ
ncbi:hypothetical protein ALC56_05122 [Trachymyrmex septentrionalis]|uniref:Uncharacterized protein n=1 Tax=Trachymyrmex septentrionalis TaxID=34720 RepID=A0A195FJK1_9HYME|nr:hypothetical protein ALC56_05122 [Trachymyrmex septentrionalis]